MDTKEKVRDFIITKIASVINGLTDTISRDMNLNNREHMKLKESLTSITDKHLDNLNKELEELFKQDSNEEAVTGDRTKMSSGFIGRRLIIDPRELESLSNAITEEHKDNLQPKKHKCSSGDRLDILEAKVKEIEAEMPRLKRFAHSHFASELSL
jgi:hypothetical protein